MVSTLQYDGSFDGLLSAVFHAYEYKLTEVVFLRNAQEVPSLFGAVEQVNSSPKNALRILSAVERLCGKKGVSVLLRTFLSEDSRREDLIYRFLKYLFQEKRNILGNYAHPVVMDLSKLVKSVGREKHRMEAFVRFRKLKDESFYAHIAPDYDVLPLIAPHFKKRYSAQKWILYDLKRSYGLFYDLKKVEHFNPPEKILPELRRPTELLHSEESEYESLWRDYFASTTILERKNTKLHVQHVPRRYWKYLTEKQNL